MIFCSSIQFIRSGGGDYPGHSQAGLPSSRNSRPNPRPDKTPPTGRGFNISLTAGPRAAYRMLTEPNQNDRVDHPGITLRVSQVTCHGRLSSSEGDNQTPRASTATALNDKLGLNQAPHSQYNRCNLTFEACLAHWRGARSRRGSCCTIEAPPRGLEPRSLG